MSGAQLALTLALLCGPAAAQELPLPLIPAPERLEMRPGAFPLARARRILLVPDEPPVRAAAARLATALATRGTTLTLVTSSAPAAGDFVIESSSRQASLARPVASAPGRMEKPAGASDLGTEGYRLEIAPDRVTLRAPAGPGLQHGVSTLLQLSLASDALPALAMTDRPRFGWRGVMVDVARHFRSAAWVKRLLDQMAFYKLNVLHWHLTDDQGWRVPVPRLPRLVAEAGRQHGGAYTAAELSEVLAHAAALSIRVVPEVDVPGHVTAALVAYPDLSCRAVKLPLPATWGTFDHVLCPGSESPFVFLALVVEELAGRFPDSFLHLGGDQVPRTRWRACSRCLARVASERLRSVDELQAYFLRRAAGILAPRGRRPIVWDDDRAHGFPAGTVVQAWHGEAALLEAVKAGHDVIASPESHLFLDRSALAAPLARVLAFDPVPREATSGEARQVLGAEACLRSEHLPDDATAESALFPRLLALAEVVWSPAGSRDPAAFARRLPVHRARLAAAGFAVGDPGARIALLTPRQLAGDWRQVRLDVSSLIDGPGVYALALGSDTPLPVDMLAARLERDGQTVSQVLRETSTRQDLAGRVYELRVTERPAGGRWLLELVVRCPGPRAGVAAVWMERRPLE